MKAARSESDSMPFSSSSSFEKALIASGTFCSPSSLRRAVTTMTGALDCTGLADSSPTTWPIAGAVQHSIEAPVTKSAVR